MVDVTTVGSDLTPAQQEATLADLAFFLDEFGSTRAVRAKLCEQESDIQRLGRQVQQLLNGREVDKQENDESNNEIATKDANGVDEIMMNVDFFLRAYGSTHAVRRELRIQSEKIANLRSTIRYFQKRQKVQDENYRATHEEESSGDYGEGGAKNDSVAATLTREVAENKQQTSLMQFNFSPQSYLP